MKCYRCNSWPCTCRDGVTIIHGDCREVLPLLPEVDIVLTDPPYAEETHAGARTSINETLIDFESMTEDSVREVFSMCGSIVRSWVVSFMDWRHVTGLERLPPPGLRFVRFGIWHKPNGAPQFTGDRPATGWEAVAILHKEDCKMTWNGGGHHAVWSYNKVNGPHPTMKPPALVKHLMSQFSNATDLVLDPFMGSGTTIHVAKQMRRRAIGIEREERYCQIANARLRQEVLAFTD